MDGLSEARAESILFVFSVCGCLGPVYGIWKKAIEMNRERESKHIYGLGMKMHIYIREKKKYLYTADIYIYISTPYHTRADTRPTQKKDASTHS